MFVNCRIFVGYDYVPDDILSVDDLGDVEDHPGDVAAEEHKHDADNDGGEVDLFLHRLSLAAMGVPGKNSIPTQTIVRDS